MRLSSLTGVTHQVDNHVSASELAGAGGLAGNERPAYPSTTCRLGVNVHHCGSDRLPVTGLSLLAESLYPY